jgi:Skp family chaperone for outer membrane proteins
MKKHYKQLLVFVVLMLPVLAFSQGAAPKGGSSKLSDQKEPITSHAQRSAAKRQWWEQRRNEWAEKKKIKDHAKRLQTKDVLKRMKKDRKKAERHTENKREPFYIRWFSR